MTTGQSNSVIRRDDDVKYVENAINHDELVEAEISGDEAIVMFGFP
jgi:hypothetical protein